MSNKIEDHVVSLEMAKKLSQLDYKKDTLHHWVNCTVKFEDSECYLTDLGRWSVIPEYYLDWVFDAENNLFLDEEEEEKFEVVHYGAPLATELLEEMPDRINQIDSFDYHKLVIDKNDKYYSISYQKKLYDEKKGEGVEYISPHTEEDISDALAQVWIYLKQQNLL